MQNRIYLSFVLCDAVRWTRSTIDAEVRAASLRCCVAGTRLVFVLTNRRLIGSRTKKGKGKKARNVRRHPSVHLSTFSAWRRTDCIRTATFLCVQRHTRWFRNSRLEMQTKKQKELEKKWWHGSATLAVGSAIVEPMKVAHSYRPFK